MKKLCSDLSNKLFATLKTRWFNGIQTLRTILVCTTFAFTTNIGAQGFTNIAPQQNILHTLNTDMNIGGAGVSFFDFDNDGWDDISFTQVFDSLVFYKNNNGVFTKAHSIAYIPHETKQVLWVDYDSDGDNDLFVVTYQGPCYLFQNNGNFEFTDVTIEAGLLELTFNLNHHGVSFADFDRDGHLDFYIGRYITFTDDTSASSQNVLFKNNGDGTFTNVTEQAGVANGIQPSFMGVWLDANNNGWPDLYVINDRVLWGNSLYLNNGDGTFTDYTEESGAEMFGEDPMCAAFADFDNDGDLDLMLANGGPPSKPPRFYVNNGDTTFTEQGQQLGINVFETFMCSWGSSFIDVDNDSFLDLYITTGLLLNDPTNENRSYLYMSNSAESFTDSPELFDFNHTAASYSAAKGDINNDGFADLVVLNAKNFNSFVWKNLASNIDIHNYIKVTLEGTTSNAMAIGSWIHVYGEGKEYHHYTRCGDSFLSQDSQHHIFGLGNISLVDSIAISYPSGHIDIHYDIDVNEHYWFKEGDSINLSVSASNSLNMCEGNFITFDAGTHNSYLWSDGSTEQTLTTGDSGTYWVEVTNEFGVTVKSDDLNVTVNPTPIVEYQTTSPLCYESNSGQIVLSSLNNTPVASVVWDNGLTGSVLEELSAGVYAYLYTDINGCEASGSVELTEPQELTLIVIDFDATAEDNGGYDLFIFGGTPPYSIFINGDPAETSSDSLEAGEYTVTVVDANDCEASETFVVNAIVNVSEPLVVAPSVYPNPVQLNGQLIIDLPSAEHITHVFVFDDSGKLCQTIQCRAHEPSLRLQPIDFASSCGVYTFIFYRKDTLVKHRRVVVVD